MLFDESTARDLHPVVEESAGNTQNSLDGRMQADAREHGSQNSNHENTALTTETSEITALATENTQSSISEHETVAPHLADIQREEMDFAAALESFEAEQSAAAEAAPTDDKPIKGTVVKLTDKYVVVDVGFKSEGMVPIAQVMGRDGQPRFQPGDSIDVVIDRGETEEGYVLLSHEKAARARVWDDIEKAYSEKSNIKGYVVDRVKGGLSVDVGGVRAFLPGSQVDLKPVRNLDGFKGQELDVRVIKLNKKRGNIVVSRKQLLEEEQSEKRSKTLEHLEEGAVLTGTVKNLTDYGAFVDLGGLDGLLHITDMSCSHLILGSMPPSVIQ
jgi:small subunit ribosomal protein S1